MNVQHLTDLYNLDRPGMCLVTIKRPNNTPLHTSTNRNVSFYFQTSFKLNIYFCLKSRLLLCKSISPRTVIDYMVFSSISNYISVISRRPVHLSMLSWSSFYQSSSQYSFQVSDCFPT